MLIALGFLAASLVGLLLLPAFWSRAVRLTTRRMRDTMPLTELEIAADRDKIRAEYAIKMHKLETLVEQVRLAGARQQIDINRRDARINVLEAEQERLGSLLEEAQNARRVLEQTITERLPKVEGRLTEAKKVLHARDREIAELARKVEAQAAALAETEAAAASGQSGEEPVARAEGWRAWGLSTGGDGQLKAELERLKARLGEATQAADSVQARRVKQVADLNQQITALRARNDEQAIEIARLKAAQALEDESAGGSRGGAKDSRLSLKARLQAAEAQAEQQSDTILKLRAELAHSAELLLTNAQSASADARQLAGISGGVVPQARRAGGEGRGSLAQRMAVVRDAQVDAGINDPERDSAGGDVTGARTPPVTAGAPVLVAVSDEPSLPVGEAAFAEQGAAPQTPEVAQSEDQLAHPPAAAKRPRLLDRIAGLSRTS
jgi:hypothetical protein